MSSVFRPFDAFLDSDTDDSIDVPLTLVEGDLAGDSMGREGDSEEQTNNNSIINDNHDNLIMDDNNIDNNPGGSSRNDEYAASGNESDGDNDDDESFDMLDGFMNDPSVNAPPLNKWNEISMFFLMKETVAKAKRDMWTQAKREVSSIKKKLLSWICQMESHLTLLLLFLRHIMPCLERPVY